jgi:transposase-like protein
MPASDLASRPTSAPRLKQLEKENFELKRANEILNKTSAYLTLAELDRRAN